MKATSLCPTCKQADKAFSAKGKQYGYCMPCWTQITKKWRNANPEKRRQYKRNAYHKNSYGKESQWKRDLVKLYGITEEQWQEMFKSQNGVCAICHKHQVYRKLSVDHNHKTGKVRGLLCNRCNRLLGYAFDSQNILQAAADYLQRTN